MRGLQRALAGVLFLVLAVSGLGCSGILGGGDPYTDYLPATYVHGKVLRAGRTDDGPAVASSRWETSDPRLSGDVTYASERKEISRPVGFESEALGGVAAGTFEVVNAVGSWSGNSTEISVPEAGLDVRTILLRGHGGHHGLSAYLVVDAAATGEDAFQGFLFPGTLSRPPIPGTDPERFAPAPDPDTTPALVTGTLLRSPGDPPMDPWWHAVTFDDSSWGRWDASDPRLGGEVSYVANAVLFGGWHQDEPGAAVSTGTYRVVNTGGRWSGHATEVYLQCCPAWSSRVALLRGEGAYEGLSAYVVTADDDLGEGAFMALIFPGRMPSAPGLPAGSTSE